MRRRRRRSPRACCTRCRTRSSTTRRWKNGAPRRRCARSRVPARWRPRSPSSFRQRWQHATEDTQLAGPRGLAEVLTQLAGEELPAEAWEDTGLPLRVGDYKREWLDQLTLSGEFVWLKLSGSWRGPLSKAPLAIVPRAELAEWLQLLGERREP